MTAPDPEPGPLLAGFITVTASAYATHPDGADLSELPDLTPEADNETENH